MMISHKGKYIELSSDVIAISVPSGERITLYKGTEVRITQSLGGAFTVVTHQGAMSSISGEQAPALGQEVPKGLMEKYVAVDDESLQKAIRAKLKMVYDPEIPHSVVDLGLVYGTDFKKIDSGAYAVEIKMTLTAPGCGMGEVLKKDAEDKIKSIEGVESCVVEIVLDPPWTPDLMNPVLRRELY
jgi:probable FeS assembly SUF system protein SufT